MKCVVTAGPTIEPLDDVRRLTNFSTGRLGAELSNYLTERGHEVTLLLGRQASFTGKLHAAKIESFATTADLRELLHALASQPVEALFHAAAVSDFSFGKVWRRNQQGKLIEIRSGKISTRHGTLLAELVPTPKIIQELRSLCPKARIVGWKYEVVGERDTALRLAEAQIASCITDACVANGPAYGTGFGFVRSGRKAVHLADSAALFEALEAWLRK
jgi:phosphopantothenoylcysteine synthetase/decarboxylase